MNIKTRYGYGDEVRFIPRGKKKEVTATVSQVRTCTQYDMLTRKVGTEVRYSLQYRNAVGRNVYEADVLEREIGKA